MKRRFGLSRYGKSEKAKAIRKLDQALSQLIRERDKDSGCISCGRRDVPFDAGHFRRRECMATRFHYQNVNAQCVKENRFEGGKPYEYSLALDKKWGKGTAQKLYKLSQKSVQWEIAELEQLTSAAKHSFLAYQQLYDQLFAAKNIK